MKPSLASAPTVITCHSNADWDALSSMIGMSMIYPDSIMIFPGSMEKPLNQFFNETAVFLYTFKNIKEIDHASVKRVVVVDTQIRSRVPQVQELLTRNNFEGWMQKLMERLDRQDELLLAMI